MKRTDADAIMDVMSHNVKIEVAAQVIAARSSDRQVLEEVKLILSEVDRSRATLSGWWRKARRRTKEE